MNEKMQAALKEYAEGLKSADYIAQKYGVDRMDLHRAYARLCAKGRQNGL